MANKDQIEVKDILGVPVKVFTVASATNYLDDALKASQPTPVAFFNAHTAIHVCEDPRVGEAMQKFTIFNDGLGINIACFMKYGKGFPDNLNGTDFIPAYLENSKHSLRMYLLGARSDVVQETAQILAQSYPRHRIVGFHDGYFPKEKSEEIARDIRSTNANFLLVAMGNSGQEMWIVEYFEKTGATLALGVGGLFDFISKRVPRAPRFVRAMYMEWFWRLLCEPRRLWKRYTIGSAKFLAYCAKDALTHRLK
jgi:alpha-1,3-mannosyltransferase